VPPNKQQKGDAMSKATKITNKKSLNENVTLDETGKIKLSASVPSSKHDFDFLRGKFNVHHKRLKSWLSNSNEWIELDGSMENQTILIGIGNVERHYMTKADGSPVEGFALRLFDPQTRLWSIYWADSQNGILDIPVVGSFEGNKGYFFANDHFNGREILLQFEWDVTDPSQPVWRQAVSADQGNVWEWNWYMYFTKSDQDVYGQLVKNEQQLMDAIAVGDTAVWQNFLHEDCLIAVEDGKTLSRNELVSSIKPLPAGYHGRIVIIEPNYQRYDDTIVLSFINDEYLEVFGQKIHTQYRQTDTWKNFDGEWKMVAMQLFEIPKNPLPVSLPESVLTRYIGTYALSNDRKCIITVEGGKLYAEKTGREKEELLAETEDIFFRKNDGRGRVIFIKDTETAYHLIERRAGEDLVWKKEA
jgi:Domain of unknown function (DUF4440)